MAPEKFKDSLECPSPRNSLVKGERIIRSEERPELEIHSRVEMLSYTIDRIVMARKKGMQIEEDIDRAVLSTRHKWLRNLRIAQFNL